MISFVLLLHYQVFSISEFQFCYNYVYDSPFQENVNLNMSTVFTFDQASQLISCTETQNVIFRQTSQPVVSLQLNLNVDTQQTSFALFFYVFKNVEIQNSVINLNLKNGANQNASMLVHTCPEFTISIFSTIYSVQTDSSAFKNIYGITQTLEQKLTVNQSQFLFTSSSGITNYYGLCQQAIQVSIENCSFNLNANAVTAVGLIYLSTGFVQISNISISGQLSGTYTYGLIYQGSAQVTMNLITFKIKTTGSTHNCGFIQSTIESATVSITNVNFIGFSFLPSEPTSYGAGQTCPCVAGANLAQGLCNCSVGSSLVGGQCQCTPGATMVGNTCVCTTGATMVNGVCVCTAGATLSAGICQCTSGATLIGGVCVCTTNAILIAGICVCQPAYSALSAGVCVCTPTYSTMSGNTCICTPAYSSMVSGVCKCTPTSSYMNSGVCACPTNSIISATQCTCQPAYSTMSAGACVCTPAYTLMSGSTCTCTPSYTTLVSGVCTCPAGATLTSGACVCTATGSSMSSAGVCVCPAGASLSGSACVCNVAGSTLQSNKCVCTKDYKASWLYWNGGNYWCPDKSVCCSTNDAGPSYTCSNGKTYWSGCSTYTSYVT
ncbi:Conserved_hypothetical protein [Hexamita inflata]|uniref:Uncharacterized protein n=1 Tax=Hexamita inflata TaxID=28002 RepID=A0AA86R2F6_9EUKA|nr:Conserved hypothetical protein [Hexamita inflata]